MVDLEEILSGYFNYKKDLNAEYENGIRLFYLKSTGVVRFESSKYQLRGAISHYYQDSKYSEAVLHIPDNVVIRTSKEKCLFPLSFVPSCNYMYYGCYMSIACYLLKVSPKYITLYHPIGNHDKFVLKYRPEVAKVFLDNRFKSLEAIRRISQKEVVKKESIQTLELYS